MLNFKVENILRRGGIGELCTEPRLKVLIKCYLSKDKEVLNQVEKRFLILANIINVDRR